tara:strand:- start:1045 stop:1722 length:678 start_codon:yes stop_codon:yes gene_type:complete
MSHLLVLIFGSLLAASSPYLAPRIGLDLNSLVLIITLLSLFSQELLVIQLSKKRENIAFTRRFYRHYPVDKFYAVRYSSTLFGLSILFFLLVFSNFATSGKHLIYYISLPLIAKFLYEPLLGTYLYDNKKTIQYMFAYFVINIFALTSSLAPVKLSIIPDTMTQSYVLLMTVSTLLTLRLAYYESFCFNKASSLDSQIGHVLIALFLLTLPKAVRIGELLLLELR